MIANMGELGVANSKGYVPADEARGGSGSGWNSGPPPDLASIRSECLSTAEEAAEQVFNWVHPTLDSEEKRRDVIEYVQQLVHSRLNCEVVSYGSVPLKTYLPDGDIDFTVLKGPNDVESLAQDVLTLLQDEEQNENAEFPVKEVEFIDAEVKLVKCFVRNFVIDISINQLGGLSTLCFLEQVDRFIGRDHLFKRSIILIKTWCYYESRILGAHHGLISTYALEILVLYIFNHFHSSLTGPLSALYKFLDYYGQFDWENYCICLKGPVLKSSLPDIIVEMPEGGSNPLFLGAEYLENCLELFSVPSRELEANSRSFQPKHMNIIDPLRENNNLGRSIHRGNFFRIRSAFKFGAHNLGQVLLRPRDEVAEEICKFFKSTRSRHGHQCKSSIRRLALDFGDEESITESSSSQVELFPEDDEMLLLKSPVRDFGNMNSSIGQHVLNLDLTNEEMGEVSPEIASEGCYSADAIFESGYRLSWARHGLDTSNSSSNYSVLSLSDSHLHDPRSKSSTENGSSEAQLSDLLSSDSDRLGFFSWSEKTDRLVEMKSTYRWCVGDSEAALLKGILSEDTCFDFREMDSVSIGGDSEAFDPPADLTGDYDGNIRSLVSGRLCHGSAFSSSPSTSHLPSSPPRIENRKPWDVVRWSIPLKMNRDNDNSNDNNNNDMYYHMVSTDQTSYSCPDSHLSGNAFRFDGKPKARGTGTYFPDVDFVCMEWYSYGRGRNKARGNKNHFHWYSRANGTYPAGKTKSFENGGHEVSPTRKRYYRRKRRSDNTTQSNYMGGGENRDNGGLSPLCRIKFGSLGNLCDEVISRSTLVGGSTVAASLKPKASSALLIRQRVAGQSIRLKSEDEFPPLCQ